MINCRTGCRWILAASLAFVVVATPSYLSHRGNMEAAAAADAGAMDGWMDFWLFRLTLNLIGYATIVVPGYLFIRWVRQSGYLERAGSGFFRNIVHLCVQGSEAEKPGLEEGATTSSDTSTKPELPMFWQAAKLVFCAGGLLGTYLIWGLLQERIMAFEYNTTDGSPGENFKNSQFLVFMNRILAFVTAVVIITIRRQPKHIAPLYKYSYSSFSNIMSSWCQYEALKFVSFPMQVLTKSCKVIPVMLMGKVISNKKYQAHEYLTALMISVGVGIFLLSSQDSIRHKGSVTTFSGIIILAGYLGFDAFTSNWQGELFTRYKMSSFQMMAGVNLFSVIFTSVSLIEQGGFVESMAFMLRHSLFVFHVVILSICSAFGQLFIFYTIQEFGPVTFTIIMTCRQALAILLSCIIYNHPVSSLGVVGVLLVFAAIFAKTYIGHQAKKKARAAKMVAQAAKGPSKV